MCFTNINVVAEHDLMTHEHVSGKFAELTAIHIKQATGGNRYQQVAIQDNLNKQYQGLRHWFSCVEYGPHGQLIYDRSYSCRKERERQGRKQIASSHNQSDGKYFTGFY